MSASAMVRDGREFFTRSRINRLLRAGFRPIFARAAVEIVQNCCNSERSAVFYSVSMKQDFNDPHEEQDALWDLLGEAPPAEASPMFAHNVLREIRKESWRGQENWLSIFFAWISAGSAWSRVVATGACAAALALAVALPGLFEHSPMSGLTARVDTQRSGLSAHGMSAGDRTMDVSSVEVIANLEQLIALEEHSLWLDSALQ